MSRKYRQAFKETLCRCFLSPADRALLARTGRSGYYISERSTCMSHTNAMNNRLSAERHFSHQLTPLVTKNNHAGNNLTKSRLDVEVRPCSRPDRTSLTEDLLPKDTHSHSPAGDEYSRDKPKLPTININGRPSGATGTCSNDRSGSESGQSSPGTMAGHIREELEMDTLS